MPNRKAQLTDLAAELFRRNGYHQVGVQEIAAAAGLTGPAVYRHFRSKQEILAHVLLAGVDAFAAAADEALAPDVRTGRLGGLSVALARLSVERRETTALWRWQGRHLEPDDQAAVVRRAGRVMDRWVAELRLARPDLPPPDAELLCWAAMSVFGSTAVHHVSVPRARFVRLLATMADAVLASPVPQPSPAPRAAASGAAAFGVAGTGGTPFPAVGSEAVAAPGTGGNGVVEPDSRREAVLAGATRLFRERGYHAVSMEEIGAAVGIAGPSVYRHFASKAELLCAACRRMADRLAAEATRALAAAAGPADALDRLVDSYVGTALAHRDLLAVYAVDSPSLPDRDRAELLRLQRAYVGRWVAALRAVSPGLPEPEARITVHAGLTVANDLVRTHRLLARPHLPAELAALIRTVLHAGATAATR